MQYDYWIVGAGLFGATFANLAAAKGKKCLVMDKRAHIAGNAYTEKVDGIVVHRYGAHIFHTDDTAVWQYITSFGNFYPYRHTVTALSGGKRYALPFNMNTFEALWGVHTVEEAQAKLAEQTAPYHGKNANLEEYALSTVGPDIYETLIKGYTQKQWGRHPRSLPASILRRIPLRFRYDNDYFESRYQGIPYEGYTPLVERMLAGCDVLLDTDYFDYAPHHTPPKEKTLYTGSIDRFCGYRMGVLPYRSVYLKDVVLPRTAQQGAVYNYTDLSVPYTRTIEHKHFVPTDTTHSIVSYEYSREWQVGIDPYYPINAPENDALYRAYRAMGDQRKDMLWGGRLGNYRYYDMDQAIACAMQLANDELH